MKCVFGFKVRNTIIDFAFYHVILLQMLDYYRSKLILTSNFIACLHLQW